MVLKAIRTVIVPARTQRFTIPAQIQRTAAVRLFYELLLQQLAASQQLRERILMLLASRGQSSMQRCLEGQGVATGFSVGNPDAAR